MHEKFIAATSDGLYGHFGYGQTELEAMENLKAAGGTVRKVRGKNDYAPKKGYQLKVWRLTSDFPFAPNDREANENEADGWIDQGGCLNWIRCEREVVRTTEHNSKINKN